MRPLIKLAVGLLAFYALSPNLSLGCSLGIPPISEFDTKQYVFKGEVQDVVGPYNGRIVSGPAWGLRIKVEEIIYLPRPSAGYVEVFPYHLTSMCGSEGWDKKELLRYYPIGSHVRVIAKESTLLGSQLPHGDIRLEATVRNRGSIARDFDEQDPESSPESIYDYGKFWERWKMRIPDDPRSLSDYYLPSFELRKDLLRLKNAESEAERMKILERLLIYPYITELDYPKMAKTYVHDPDTVNQLKEKWAAWAKKVVEMVNK